MKTDMARVQKNVFTSDFSTFPFPTDMGFAGSSRFHEEAPEQSKSTAQIPVQKNQIRGQQRARKKRQLGH